jgi:protein-S-isoprenylcysteine O-methyltransferase Ste14
MMLKLLNRLIPFYLGIFMGYFAFLRPENIWIYGVFGGIFMGLMIIDDLRKEEELVNKEKDDGNN